MSKSLYKSQLMQELIKNTNLQQASGSREAQSERLAADVEGLWVRLLRADRKRVRGTSGDAPIRQPEQGVRTESHG